MVLHQFLNFGNGIKQLDFPGLVRKLDIGDAPSKYENKIDSHHHDHMICLETGDIIEFYNEELENLQDEIAKNHGYKVVRHVHQLFVKPIN